MIEFNGQISEKVQLDRMKKVKKKEIFLFLLTIIFLWIVVIAVGLILDALQYLWIEALICSVVLIGVIFTIAWAPQKTVLRFKLSPHIIITEKELSLELCKNGKSVWRKKNLSKVKKILDCGDVYYIIFRFGDITNAWICQKSNIVNGTTEEFETHFKSKIHMEVN